MPSSSVTVTFVFSLSAHVTDAMLFSASTGTAVKLISVLSIVMLFPSASCATELSKSTVTVPSSASVVPSITFTVTCFGSYSGASSAATVTEITVSAVILPILYVTPSVAGVFGVLSTVTVAV